MIAGEDEVFNRRIAIDRISELPDSIIHHILDLMRSTKDVARTQLLSKNWKRVFDSYQTFDFDETWFRSSERFEEYVEKSLATRLDRLDCADKFSLRARGFSDGKRIAAWIRAAIAKNVKELYVSADLDFSLPDTEMDMTRSSSLTSLSINGDLVHSLAAMKMCNLREIWIGSVWPFDSNVTKKIEENCPLLEVFKLSHCQLSHLHIPSFNKLKTLEVIGCYYLEHIKIEAPNLETFRLIGDTIPRCRDVDLRSPRNLRNLSFRYTYIDDSAFEDLISTHPLLEKLELCRCPGVKKPKICSHTLSSLVLDHCENLERVEVDAPNLHSFQYKGGAMPFPFLNAPRLSQANFSFHPLHRRSNEEFLWNLNGYISNGFKLLVYMKQNMKIYEGPREDDEPYQVHDQCEVELTKSPSKAMETFENWVRPLRESNVSCLVKVSSSINELRKSIKALILSRSASAILYPNKVNFSSPKDVVTTTYVLNGPQCIYKIGVRR